MRISVLATVILASLLVTSVHATPITADDHVQSPDELSISLGSDLVAIAADPFAASLNFNTATPVDATLVIASPGSGYRFSQFATFQSVTQYCNETSGCIQVGDVRSVPEPGTTLLLATGLLLLLFSRRRRSVPAHVSTA